MRAPKVAPAAPELLRIQEFADRLKLSVWTARRMAYTGAIASVKLGKLLMIPAPEVDRLVAEGMRPRLSTPGLARVA